MVLEVIDRLGVRWVVIFEFKEGEHVDGLEEKKRGKKVKVRIQGKQKTSCSYSDPGVSA